jgi:hypothetical protein
VAAAELAGRVLVTVSIEVATEVDKIVVKAVDGDPAAGVEETGTGTTVSVTGITDGAAELLTTAAAELDVRACVIVVVRAGQFVTLAAQDVIVITSVLKRVEVASGVLVTIGAAEVVATPVPTGPVGVVVAEGDCVNVCTMLLVRAGQLVTVEAHSVIVIISVL